MNFLRGNSKRPRSACASMQSDQRHCYLKSITAKPAICKGCVSLAPNRVRRCLACANIKICKSLLNIREGLDYISPTLSFTRDQLFFCKLTEKFHFSHIVIFVATGNTQARYLKHRCFLIPLGETLSFFLYILPGARFRALSAGVHCTLRVAG